MTEAQEFQQFLAECCRVEADAETADWQLQNAWWNYRRLKGWRRAPCVKRLLRDAGFKRRLTKFVGVALSAA